MPFLLENKTIPGFAFINLVSCNTERSSVWKTNHHTYSRLLLVEIVWIFEHRVLLFPAQSCTKNQVSSRHVSAGRRGRLLLHSWSRKIRNTGKGREEKGKNPKPSWLPTSYGCTACMVGMCLTRARSPDTADELSWHLPFCGYATSRKNPLFICQIPEPSFTLPHRNPNSPVCSGDLVLAWVEKNTLQQTQWGWGHKSSPSQSSHPAPPSSRATRRVPNNSEQLWSLLQGSLAFAFYRQFHHCCSVFWALNTTLWWFNKLQISEFGLQKPKPFLAQCCKVALSVCQTIPTHPIDCSYSAAPNPCQMWHCSHRWSLTPANPA